MWERHLGRRFLLIGAVLAGAVFILAVRPLKGGLDIAGGVSMIFEIDDTGLSPGARTGLAEQMKQLLQRRVDPKGVYNLTWRVVGQNRIEVQMPLPPADARQRREAYSAALNQLFEANVSGGELEGVFRASAQERPERIRELARGSERRAELIREAAARYDAYQAALEAARRAARSSASAPATAEGGPGAPATGAATQTAPAPEDVALDVRDAEEYLQDAKDAVLATNINPERFQETLELDPTSAQRKRTLELLAQEHPDLVPLINDVVAKHAAWRERRGFLEGPADLKRLLRGAGKLDFRMLAEPDPDNPTRYDTLRKQLEESGPRARPGDAEGWFRIDNPVAFFNLDSPADLARFDPATVRGMVAARRGEDYYVLAKLDERHGLLTGPQANWKLKGASPGRDELGRPCVFFTFDAGGGTRFRRLTSENVGKQLCILLDDVAYSSATIQEAIGASGRIMGEFSQEKVNYLVQTMQAGALPARLKDTPLSERTIEARLGQANLRAALKAGVIGLIAVAAFMIGYYMLNGAVAVAALLMNLLLVLAVMAMLGATFTLDGIAGVILSMGMAVDANVLIYERMREEKERGASLRIIIKNGYDKAFSTILDSNITTLLTCVIIYYLGSEEIKGFGLTLGWGIIISMFTALFVTRTVFSAMVRFGLLKDVRMLKLIGVPKIDWYGMRKFFIPASTIITLGGLASIFVRSPRDLFDVEFVGGISAVFETRNPTDGDAIQASLAGIGRSIGADVIRLGEAQIQPRPEAPGSVYVSLPGVAPDRLAAITAEALEDLTERHGVSDTVGGERIAIALREGVTPEQLGERLRLLSARLRSAGENIANARVNAIIESRPDEDTRGRIWNVVTLETNKRLVQYALVHALGENIDIQPRLAYEVRGEGGYFPITAPRLESVVAGLPPGAGGDVTDYYGGVAFYFDHINPPQTVEALRNRLSNMRLQPGYETYPWRQFEVFGVEPAGQDSSGRTTHAGVVVAIVDANYSYFDDIDEWRSGLAERELELARAALDTEQSVQKVTQFKPQIAEQAQTKGILALVFSWLVIIGYLWVRFGTAMYGMASVVALVHDVMVALAFVAFSGFIGGPHHPIGAALLVNDFKINMAILAAFLTIIGYSTNDTIVVFDRIRETRGRLGRVTPEIINSSINQTLSRTLLTGMTTLFVLTIMYIFGGESIRGFNYCMIIGILTGTYSSIAVAAPLLLAGRRAQPSAA